MILGIVNDDLVDYTISIFFFKIFFSRRNSRTYPDCYIEQMIGVMIGNLHY